MSSMTRCRSSSAYSDPGVDLIRQFPSFALLSANGYISRSLRKRTTAALYCSPGDVVSYAVFPGDYAL